MKPQRVESMLVRVYVDASTLCILVLQLKTRRESPDRTVPAIDRIVCSAQYQEWSPSSHDFDDLRSFALRIRGTSKRGQYLSLAMGFL